MNPTGSYYSGHAQGGLQHQGQQALQQQQYGYQPGYQSSQQAYGVAGPQVCEAGLSRSRFNLDFSLDLFVIVAISEHAAGRLHNAGTACRWTVWHP
jgi:hypothetical protein